MIDIRALEEGLSPHTRGNLRYERTPSTDCGPIPAHAGEPGTDVRRTTRLRAYPRTRGGTTSAASGHFQYSGLSPHTRGNRKQAAFATAAVGPIPAHAGEPSPVTAWRVLCKAYPRTRGGTITAISGIVHALGLSPHTRGNHLREVTPHASEGPIPAHAGEPEDGPAFFVDVAAYPRTRGGTAIERLVPRVDLGLSPHTRGNPP